MLCVWEEWGRGRKETDNFKCKPQIIYSSRGITDNVHVSKISGTLETEPTPMAERADGWWCFCHVFMQPLSSTFAISLPYQVLRNTCGLLCEAEAMHLALGYASSF